MNNSPLSKSDEEYEIYLKQILDNDDCMLSAYAAKNHDAIREFRSKHSESSIRSNFGIDIDNILHNMFYNRYADKTQVFSFYRNDDITRRALHVQLVSRIGRIIGKALKLNLELIEAIALGHDIGHTPFGHKGESFLSELYFKNCGKRFNHNVHSVRILKILTQGNFSLQTLDGILCHCGEKAFLQYKPAAPKTFEEFYATLNSCYTDESIIKTLKPFTLEGCVVRISDMIAYMGKDRQDAYRAGLRIPEFKNSSSDILGTNSKIINNLVCNIVKNSIGQPYLSMDKDVFDEFIKIKEENDKYIYANEKVDKPYLEVVKPMMEKLYPHLLDDVREGSRKTFIYKHHISNGILQQYYSKSKNGIDINDIVVDYIASMTDDYFIDLFAKLFPDDPLNDEIKYVSYFDE